MLQVISSPQQLGDFIFPSQDGHLDTCTLDPLSVVIISSTRGTSHLAHVALTAIPQLSHS